MKPKAKPTNHLKEKKAKKTQQKRASKPTAKAAKPIAKATRSPMAKKPVTKKTKSSIASVKKDKIKTKQTAKSKKTTEKPVAKKVRVDTNTSYAAEIESLSIVHGAKFVKIPFFFDIEEEAGKRKYVVKQKLPEKPTACSRPKISSNLDSKNLVEFLSQQLEYENKTYFEGCEGQICVKCNSNNVDAKFYVDKSLGYCTECAMLLGLGQSKEGVFSDAQMELMRHSMEKSMENVKDIDENDLESALDDMDTLELEETLLSVEEDADFNV
jgi:hypothetical protein